MSDTHLGSASVEDLARMLLALTSEVWIMRDRMAVTERLLEQKFGLAAVEIDRFAPDADFSAELQTLRDRVIGAVVGAPAVAGDDTVAAILDRAGDLHTGARTGIL